MSGEGDKVVARLLSAALAVLVAALALWGSVQLIQAVWPWLVGMAVTAGVAAVGVAIVRRRHARW